MNCSPVFDIHSNIILGELLISSMVPELEIHIDNTLIERASEYIMLQLYMCGASGQFIGHILGRTLTANLFRIGGPV